MQSDGSRINNCMEIKEAQEYIQRICDENDWNGGSQAERFLLFTEEVGELAKAIRVEEGMYVEPGREPEDLAGEFADVFSYLLDLANRYDIDLEKAMLEKQKKNEKRTWESKKESA